MGINDRPLCKVGSLKPQGGMYSMKDIRIDVPFSLNLTNIALYGIIGVVVASSVKATLTPNCFLYPLDRHDIFTERLPL